MEDEILKVAVMKLGENQWPRISFLLSSSFFQKSAMQCKARWWLHQSINKTEWTRQEDEKLLHAVKITPGQWRTIARVVVRRTASECFERYENLLDAACGRDDDMRKLCNGKRDSDSEAKPASLDPVDMEAYESQMISEARARLSNSKGKKGIRKAREKQLEVGRRLASLQKRTVLKAAGIDDVNRKRRVKGPLDYNAEILFEKKPPSGFFNVTEECYTVKKPKSATTIEELEGEKRLAKEARFRKEGAERQDISSAMLLANKLSDQA